MCKYKLQFICLILVYLYVCGIMTITEKYQFGYCVIYDVFQGHIPVFLSHNSL